MKNIFFDLDGTLIDSKKRLFNLFADLTKINISYEEYWKQKKDMISNETIMRNHNFSEEAIHLFLKNWLINIESEKYLACDECFDYTIKSLEILKRTKYSLYVITARQSEEQAAKQIQNLNLTNYFKKILVTNQKITKDKLILNQQIELSPQDIIIGDTGIDIQAGKKLKIKTIAVLSGFRNKEQLMKYNPDYIYNNIYEFCKENDL